ncbi:MAG: MFS transporter [Bryobacteraceae bacterium]
MSENIESAILEASPPAAMPGGSSSPWFAFSTPDGVGRGWLLLLLFFSIFVNLVDRQVLSVLAPIIRDELHLSNAQYSYVIASFLFGLTLAQIPSGMLIDRRGPRFGLAVIMVWWSIANGLHSIARSTLDLCGFRFLMGVGEAGNYSGGIKVISQRFPPQERALAGGIFNSGTVLGSFLAPPAIVFVASRFGWRMAFIIPSVLGLVWLIPWLLVYRDRQKATVQRSVQRLLPLLAMRVVWGALLMRALSGPVMHFYWYWLPEYLKRERHFSMEAIGWLSGVPFLFAGLGNIAGGWFSGQLMARGWSADRARKLSFRLGAALCGCSVLVPFAPGEILPVAMICVAVFGLSGFVATHIGMLTDLFPSGVLARVAGVTGVGEGCVNMAVTLATGALIDNFSYLPVFIAAGCLPALAASMLFVFIRKIEPVPQAAFEQ